MGPHTLGSSDILSDMDRYVFKDMSVQNKITTNPPKIRKRKVNAHTLLLSGYTYSFGQTKYPRSPYQEMTTKTVFMNVKPMYTNTVMKPGYRRFFGIISKVITM